MPLGRSPIRPTSRGHRWTRYKRGGLRSHCLYRWRVSSSQGSSGLRRTMIMKNIVLAVAIGFAVAGCATSPLTIDLDYDTAMDFGAQKTFAWMPPTGNAVANELLVKRIRSSVDQQLQAKGRAPAADNPNFLIAMDLSGKTAYGGAPGGGVSGGISRRGAGGGARTRRQSRRPGGQGVGGRREKQAHRNQGGNAGAAFRGCEEQVALLAG